MQVRKKNEKKRNKITRFLFSHKHKNNFRKFFVNRKYRIYMQLSRIHFFYFSIHFNLILVQIYKRCDNQITTSSIMFTLIKQYSKLLTTYTKEGEKKKTLFILLNSFFFFAVLYEPINVTPF